LLHNTGTGSCLESIAYEESSVADPDPHVFGPPGSGSTGQRYGRIRILLLSCKKSKKNLDSYYFVTIFDILSLKNGVNVPSKSNKQKKSC
jgi:hypothetical protein